jgi:hypothetical protein
MASKGLPSCLDSVEYDRKYSHAVQSAFFQMRWPGIGVERSRAPLADRVCRAMLCLEASKLVLVTYQHPVGRLSCPYDLHVLIYSHATGHIHDAVAM